MATEAEGLFTQIPHPVSTEWTQKVSGERALEFQVPFPQQFLEINACILFALQVKCRRI